MNETTTRPTNGDRTCPRCGAGFTCGVAAGESHCWCFELPQVVPIDSIGSEGCLCPTCLQERIQSIQTQPKPTLDRDKIQSRRNVNDGS